ncbi:hypothetical protein MLD38_024488 [Melastoma candidum]|uniref:Uncharacterized protein n=1 Tax=Melastoma candidum TaxID=119954 RepID=A0ACB9NVG5_9MYRT|nr:hypothetical protein MLD38_024488 [Melastoma candidum]
MRRSRSYMSVQRAAFVFLMLLGGTIWFFFPVFHGRRGSLVESSSTVGGGSENLKSRLLELARRRRVFWDFDLHVVIKRRVPTGPDPIHNRFGSLALNTYL